MEPTVIREEVQVFLQACQFFTGFALYNGLTNAEREAIATVARTLVRDFKPSSDSPPVATTIFNFPPID